MNASRRRLAWFSPMPPVRSGVATNSADLVAALRQTFAIDVFVDKVGRPDVYSAHDFVWRHHTQPYDLTVYQLGNSSHHNFIWPYLFRHPGLTVLHDAHLHHARAAALLTERRTAEYRAEFRANDPEANVDLSELGVRGFDSHLYYMWPMTRLVIHASRVTAVHSPVMAAELREQFPAAAIEAICLSQGAPVTSAREEDARRAVRGAYGIPADAPLFGVFGGLSPDKRIPQILDAFAATLAAAPGSRLLLGGAAAAHFDLDGEIRRRALAETVTVAGYIESDDALTDCLAACDVSLNLRWPTAREVSGPWLRALAAGRATVTIDLAHMTHVPSLDPRTWRVNAAGVRGPGTGGRGPGAGGRSDAGSRTPVPVTVAIDILDEDHSLRLAMRRLATDAQLRAALGAAAREYWTREHSLESSVADYERVIGLAIERQDPRPELPAHLVNDGDRRLRELLAPFGTRAAAVARNFRAASAPANEIHLDRRD